MSVKCVLVGRNKQFITHIDIDYWIGLGEFFTPNSTGLGVQRFIPAEGL